MPETSTESIRLAWSCTGRLWVRVRMFAPQPDTALSTRDSTPASWERVSISVAVRPTATCEGSITLSLYL